MESISEQLENRIKSHDKDIEKICNLYYQGFIESIRELLQVRTQAKSLNHEILSLDDSLQSASEGVLSKGKELVRARQIEKNIVTTIDELSRCLPVLECYSRLVTQVNDRQYYPALKTLEILEKEHLTKITGYRFTTEIVNSIPKLKEHIKKSSEEDFRMFLENIRKYSSKIGEVAMRQTRKLEKRDIESFIQDFKTHEKNQFSTDDDNDVCAQDLIDFSPIYRCLHIYTVLNDKEYFEKDYRQQRTDQAKLIIQPPQGMHDNLEAYKTYIHSIVGFFVVEDHVKNTAGDAVNVTYLEDLWSTSLTKVVNDLNMSSSSCTDPNVLLRIKSLIMLMINTLKTYNYTVNQLWEFLYGMRDHYNEVLLQRWVHVFRDILDKESFLPLDVNTQEEYDDVCERFPFYSEQLENKTTWPKEFPFSAMVPEVYHQAKEFMYACMKFSEELTISPNEVATMVRKAANLLLTRSFSGCLSSVFRNPSIALTQLIQIIIDTQYLDKATPFLDDFVCKMTFTENTIIQAPTTMFHVARSEAEKYVSERICLKLDEFFELTDYNWLLVEPNGNASAYITDMLSYLISTFQSFAHKLPNIALSSCKKSCEHLAFKILDLLLCDEVKQLSIGALHQINLDLMQCEIFADSEPVPGLQKNELTKFFDKIRQLLDLLMAEDWSTYLHDYGKSENQNRYCLVQPSTIIIILEKMKEAEKKTMFTVLKKSERDKKKLWETVLKQLRQLNEKQN